MKILIILLTVIGYISGTYWRTTTDTSTVSEPAKESYTKFLSTPTENREEQENNISLNLSNSGLLRINERFIKSSHVSSLNLSNNNIYFVSPEAFDLLPNLIFLNLAHNQIPLIEFRLSGKSYKLKTLILDNNNQNDHASIVIYDNFPNLEYLYIRQNHLKSISSTDTLLSLRHLYLTDNYITSESDILETTTSSLTHLHLERNLIDRFNGTKLSNLELLALDSNKIKNICNQYCSESWLSLNNMNKLKHLSLSGNEITEIEADSFAEASNLTSLDLSDNKLTTVRKNTFKVLPFLEVLSLRGNQLTILPEFFALTNIKKLDLTNNKLKSIPAGIFFDLGSLKNLSLSSNYISSVEKESFVNLFSLEELDLSDNRLENLPEGWLMPQNIIRILNLKDNYFTDIKHLSIQNAEFLENLFLERNAIEVLNVASFLNFSKNLSIHLEYQSKSRLSYIKERIEDRASNIALPYDFDITTITNRYNNYNNYDLTNTNNYYNDMYD